MTGEVRIGDQARAAATRTLDTALRAGRLDLAEYERRLVIVQAARLRKDLAPAVADLPDGSGRTGPGLRVATADRERALVQLAGALTDGRLEARAYADAEELVNRAVTYSDIDAVIGNLDAKASHTERDQAIARIEAAVAGGLLEPAERHDRVAAVRRATTDAQLAALVADLPADAGPARSPRVSHAEREAVVAQLHEAVEAGVLELPEFDERVRAVYAARLRDELARLVADLPRPAAPPAPLTALPPITQPPRKRPSFETGMATVKVAAVGWVLMIGIVIALGMAGLTALAFVVGALSAIVFVGILVWAKRTVTAAMEAESARPGEKPFLPAVEPFPGRGPTWVDVDPAEWTSGTPGTRTLGRHNGELLSIAAIVLPDGTPVAITGGADNTALVWDLTDDSLRHTLTGHTHDVVGVAAIVLPDGVPVAVTVSPDRTARVWDLRDGSQRSSPLKVGYEPRGVNCLSLADGTPVVVVHNVSEGIRRWDLRDHKPLGKVAHGSYESFVDGMFPVVLPDGTALVLATDWEGPIKAFDLKTGKTRFELLGHTGSVRSIDTTVLPDGTPVAVSASDDKTIRIWDLRRRTLRHRVTGLLRPQLAVMCTTLPDGTPIAVTCDDNRNKTVRDLRDGAELPYPIALGGDLLSAVTLPNETLILGLSDDYDCSSAAVFSLP
ncbi:WD domain-containing protein, G-beta repeat-containing protein [Amycolatopsis tolypomycina]|uniref:WD domain-containing protein, G-beta repeat-containing protein n=1 Tax=Amycolatopsis tolypomycina TaxID=208445 RepID=A0A1H4VQM2_9PSEU|nr:DUF1707 domain-containing protein [Amycolatopsis tolypomycina]SEC83160.1 WD domain-containing protein, G-beta repeat-containing protein [Amycolatopsis tolypomycina]